MTGPSFTVDVETLLQMAQDLGGAEQSAAAIRDAAANGELDLGFFDESSNPWAVQLAREAVAGFFSAWNEYIGQVASDCGKYAGLLVETARSYDTVERLLVEGYDEIARNAQAGK